MNTDRESLHKISLLEAYLRAAGRCTVAVSGGIDSILLSWIASRCLGHNALIVHATSPAVSRKDGCRVREYAARWQWNYREVVADQIGRENYQSNPLNRCYYCKSGLYCQLGQFNHGRIMSGTNMDDLGDFRPGLIAAQEQGVCHPYVECQIDKATIRRIAAHFQLTDLQDLPASPCLSSRIETGIRINPAQLSLIDRAEEYLRQHFPNQTVRLRIRKDRLVIELGDRALAELNTKERARHIARVELMARASGVDAPVYFASYAQGSAFIGDKERLVI